MKLTYKYVGEWFTVVRLDEKSAKTTKVKSWQTVDSDREPKYFLTSWFVCPDIRNKTDAEYLSKKIAAEKVISELDKKKWVSKHTKVTSDVSAMDEESVKEKLKSLGIFFHANTGIKKLKQKLTSALLK